MPAWRAGLPSMAAAVAASVNAVSFLSALAGIDTYLPSRSWPAEVFAIDADGAIPAERDARAMTARDAVIRLLDARQDALDAPIAPDWAPEDREFKAKARARLEATSR